MEGRPSLRPVLERLIGDFQQRELPALTPRDVALPALAGKADAVIGMRRSGKTYFLLQKIQELERAAVPRRRMLFLGLEDDRLLPLTAADLDLIPETFYAAFPESRTEECWFFLDEIQAVPGWERFVRRLIDAGNVRIVLSGSSARLLSREIATSLRGRSLTTELLPFSFREALRHAGIAPPDGVVGADERSLLANRFDAYLRVGGFPEVQGLDAPLRLRVLQEYVDVVVLRDVVERHGVTNVVALRHLVRTMLRNPASRFSVARVHGGLASQGVAVSKDTLHALVDHLVDAFLAFLVPRFGASERQRLVNPRKLYLVDHGLAHSARLPAAGDVGRHLENVVFLELRRRDLEVGWYGTKSGREVDFVAVDREGRRALVQVAASLDDPATRRRELDALAEGMRELGVDRGTVVTLHDEAEHAVDAGTIAVVPAWRWLVRGGGSGGPAS